MAKSKYDTHIKPRFDDIRKWKTEGLNNKQVIENLGINQDTFYEHLKNKPEFSEFLKECNEIQITQVENALYKSALGYHVEETSTKTGGDKTFKEVKNIFIKPSLGAQVFFLKNKAGDRWQDRQDIEISNNEFINAVINSEKKEDIKN